MVLRDARGGVEGMSNFLKRCWSAITHRHTWEAFERSTDKSWTKYRCTCGQVFCMPTPLVDYIPWKPIPPKGSGAVQAPPVLGLLSTTMGAGAAQKDSNSAT
jgi:hypothetical protein